MRRGILIDAKPGMQFLLTALIFISSWLVFQLLSIVSGMLIFNMGLTEIYTALQEVDSQKSIALIKYIQGITSVGMFIVTSFVIAWFISNSAIKYLRLNNFPGWLVTLMVSLLIVLTLPMNNYLTWLNGELKLPEGINWLQEYFERQEGQMEIIMERLLQVSSPWGLLVNLLIIAVIPAIGEELLFRGVIQQIFTRGFRNIHLAVFITSLIFGLLHFQFLSFLPRFVLGILLGYIFVWTKSLWMPILAHFINNGLAVVYYYFYHSGKADNQLEEVGTPGQMPVYAFFSFLIVTILLLIIRRVVKEDEAV